MGIKTLRALGLELGAVLKRFDAKLGTRVMKAVGEREVGMRDVLITSFASAYMQGGGAAMVVHGTMLGVPPNMPVGLASRFKGNAEAYGEMVLLQFEGMESGKMTAAQLAAWTKTAGKAAVWKGHDDIADDLAHLMEVRAKTWVYTGYPRKMHRDWHTALCGITIPIDSLFVLPGGKHKGAQVYGPRDWGRVADLGEHLNCSHALAFGKTLTVDDVDSAAKNGGFVYYPPTKSALDLGPYGAHPNSSKPKGGVGQAVGKVAKPEPVPPEPVPIVQRAKKDTAGASIPPKPKEQTTGVTLDNGMSRFEERLKEGVHVGKVEGELSQTDINFVLRGANRAGLTEFLAAHPLGKIAFKALESPYTVGEYDALTGVISLNVARASSTIGSTAKAGDVLGVSAWGKTRQEAMRINFVHELGHHVMAMRPDVRDVLISTLRTTKVRPISNRAFDDPYEYLCETLAAHTFFRERLTVYDPAGARMIAEVLIHLGR